MLLNRRPHLHRHDRAALYNCDVPRAAQRPNARVVTSAAALRGRVAHEIFCARSNERRTALSISVTTSCPTSSSRVRARVIGSSDSGIIRRREWMGGDQPKVPGPSVDQLLRISQIELYGFGLRRCLRETMPPS